MAPEILQLVGALRRIGQSLDSHSKFIEQQSGLTLPQLLVLEALAADGAPITAGTLAQRVSLSQGTVSLILDRLGDRGLIERVRALDDRRRVMVGLTPAGQRCLEAAPALVSEAFAREFAALEPAERNRLLQALDRVAGLMRPAVLPAQLEPPASEVAPQA